MSMGDLSIFDLFIQWFVVFFVEVIYILLSLFLGIWGSLLEIEVFLNLYIIGV
jgi:hypothetical protein